MNQNPLMIDICDEASLLEACDLLHDAEFDLEAAEFEEKIGCWTGRFAREFFEDPALIKVRHRFVFTKFTFPLIGSILRLEGVESCEVTDNSRIRWYTFNECRPSGDLYRFIFCQDMEIRMHFRDNPRGLLRDLNVLPRTRSIWRLRNPFRRGLPRPFTVERHH